MYFNESVPGDRTWCRSSTGSLCLMLKKKSQTSSGSCVLRGKSQEDLRPGNQEPEENLNA